MDDSRATMKNMGGREANFNRKKELAKAILDIEEDHSFQGITSMRKIEYFA